MASLVNRSNDLTKSYAMSNLRNLKSPNSPPRLSIVVAATEPWPAIKICLDSLLSQARIVEAEIIVADGNGNALPDDQKFQEIFWFRKIGFSVFQLRAIGLSRARGDIVAFTEDHCKVAKDWCEQLLSLHHEYPDAAAIGGSIENGSTGSIIDWINFLIAKGPFMPPIISGESQSLSGPANVSFKRNVLPTEFQDFGILHMFLNRDLRKRGLKLVMEGRLVVWHIQSLGFIGTCRMHYHNGRTIAGYRFQGLSWSGRVVRLASCFILPAFLMTQAISNVILKKRERLLVFIGLPILFLLSVCHSSGEFIGYIAGAGDSPQMVR